MTITHKKSNGYSFSHVSVDRKAGEIPIVGLGDLHYGSPHCEVAEAKKRIEWIREKKALWIGMGDLIEMATKGSIGAGVYEQIEKPQDQIDDMIKLLSPIADTCITLVKGNHEERSHKDVGIDPMMVIASQLGVNYSGWEAWGCISNSDVGYTFYAVHGASGHKNAALLLNMMDRDMRKFISTDLIFRAHSHDRAEMSCEVIDVMSHTQSVRSREQLLVGTGHFLGRAESYAAGKAMAPKPLGTIAVWLTLKGDKVRRMRPEVI